MSRNKGVVLAAGLMMGTFLSSADAIAGTGALASDNSYSVGVEGFYDNYKEPDNTVDNKAYYGSITGNYTHNWNAFFAALDGRVSLGSDDYSSVDGSVSGIPQWEFELRPRIGYTFGLGRGGSLSPYIGLGVRYYRDEFKGYDTTTDDVTYGGYDRRIFQLYLPVGATYSYTTSGGWTIAPNAEYDQFLWGQVSSRLGNLGGGVDPNTGDTIQNVNNVVEQENGWGARGSIMIGREESGWAWQAGPFVRYWDIKASTTAVGQYVTAPTSPPTTGVALVEEPYNTRLQAGLAFRVLW